MRFREVEFSEEGEEETEDKISVRSADNAAPDENDDSDLVEPPSKKLKDDSDDDFENQLKHFDLIIPDPLIPVSEKFSQLSTLLGSLLLNNVNTMQFETDFTAWTRQHLLHLLSELSETSTAFYDCLCMTLKVVPTLFEPILDKLFAVILTRHRFKSDCNCAHEAFMEQLVETFEKLHRFPKLIAKLLCCIRDNILNPVPDPQSSTSTKRRSSKMKSKTVDEKITFVLPKKFLESYGSSVSILTVGQIMDLWKTLHHNLEEECIGRCSVNSYLDAEEAPLAVFLSVVIELIVVFLDSLNVKITDYSVPVPTLEKVTQMMVKLQDVLGKFGTLVSSSKNIHYVRTFMKLTYGYCNALEFLLTHSDNFTKYWTATTPPKTLAVQGEDLSRLLPSVPHEKWILIWKAIEKSGDPVSSSIMVGLVFLKMKHLARTQQQSSNANFSRWQSSANEKGLENGDKEIYTVELESLRGAATFVWKNQHFISDNVSSSWMLLNNASENMLDMAVSYLDIEDFIENAGRFQDSSQSMPNQGIAIQNSRLLTVFILEALEKSLQKTSKLNKTKKPVKMFLRKCFGSENKTIILDNVKRKGSKQSISEPLKNFTTQAIKIVNDCISENLTQFQREDVDSVTTESLEEILSFIVQQQLELFPGIMKTLIFLNCIIIFTALIGCKGYQRLVEILIEILERTGHISQGNELLFHLHWSELLGVVIGSDLTEKGSSKLGAVILENIYVSPKVATSFGEKNLQIICDNLNFTNSTGNLTLVTFGFFIQKIKEALTKSKPLISQHLNDLAASVMSKLSDGAIIAELHSLLHNKKNRTGPSLNTKIEKTEHRIILPEFMRTLCLLQQAQPYLNADATVECQSLLIPYMRFALDFLKVNEENISKKAISTEEDVRVILVNCLHFLIECLKAYEDVRAQGAPDFLIKVWNCYCYVATKQSNDNCKESKVSTRGIVELIFKTANPDEFQLMCDSIVQRMENPTELKFVASLLLSLLDAEILDEKKKMSRKTTVDLCLYKYLQHINLWREMDDFLDVTIPYLRFQTTLMERRKLMGRTNTLAVCFSSITALPLDTIENIKTFKTAFSAACELLNALTLHRLDVLSFRSHIFLQCFQFLLSSLGKKADQKIQLSDLEIYDLRHCGQCFERICQSAKANKKEFVRVAPYLIVVLLRQFEKTTIYPEVKKPVLNGCHKLIDMCDEQGISHINSMLSPGSREIFKMIYEVYKKFYHYMGKV